MESKHKKLTPAELIKKHLKDRNHVITDEELQKVIVGVDFDTERAKTENDLNKHEKNVPHPYDLLDI